jgi:hypothetical protein
LQTIERSRRRADGRKFEPLDRVRLEVALVEGKEVFGWPGGDKIAESEITNLVSGTIGNGDFALFLKSIFLGSGATFRYAGETTLEGKRAIRFDYVVPLLTSGYHLRVPPREALVPYHGSFWLEPESLDLLRLELVVDAIPPYLGVAAASDAMDYGRAEIGGLSFLLPRQSELDMTDLNGRENRNRTRFTACRQFTGESTLSFGDVLASAPEAAAGGTKNAELPKEFEGDLYRRAPSCGAGSHGWKGRKTATFSTWLQPRSILAARATISRAGTIRSRFKSRRKRCAPCWVPTLSMRRSRRRLFRRRFQEAPFNSRQVLE